MRTVDSKEYMAGLHEARAGYPRRLVEAAFVVSDQVAGGIVDFRYTERQVDLYGHTWGQMKSWDDPFSLLLVKSRKEQATTQTDAEVMAICMSRPNVKALVIADADTTNDMSLENWDLWYNNVPDVVEAEIGGVKYNVRKTRRGEPWSTEKRVFSFGRVNVAGVYQEEAISSCEFTSVRSTRTGIGKTFDIMLFHEVGKAPAEMARRMMVNILNGLPQRAKQIYEGTPDPEQGRESYAFHLMEAMRRDDGVGKCLVRYWFLNRVNVMGEGDYRAARHLRGPFELDEEMEAVRSHPAWPKNLSVEETQALFRWREWKIRQNMPHVGNRLEQAKAVFRQEFPENDTDLWAGKTASEFEDSVRRYQQTIFREPREPARNVVPGASFAQRIWEPRILGHIYTGVLDPAKGVATGDDTSFQIMDNTTRRHVAEIHGKARIEHATEAALSLLMQYNAGIFVPETNGLGATVPDIAVRLGYPKDKIFRRKAKRTEKTSDASYINREYGYQTADKQPLARALIEAIHNGGFETPSRDAWDDIVLYDWNALRDHTPDRSMCFAIWAYLMQQGELPSSAQDYTPPSEKYLRSLQALPMLQGRGVSYVAGAPPARF